MTWFRVDDTLAFHQKTVKAGNASMGLWVRAGSWCAQQLTDGHVPAEIANQLGTAPQIARLVAVRLWVEVDGGYQFHEWTDGSAQRQPTRAEVEDRREKQRNRQRLHRERNANGSRIAAESGGEQEPLPDASQVSDHRNALVTQPGDAYPTRPDPSLLPKTPPGAAEDVSPDRAHDVEPPHDEPPMPSIPQPHPGPAVTGPTAGDAYRFVDAAVGREHPHAVRTALAIGVGNALLNGISRDVILAALVLWLEKPHLGPGALPSLISEVIRTRNRPRGKARQLASDTALAEVEAAFAAYEQQQDNPSHLRALPRGA